MFYFAKFIRPDAIDIESLSIIEQADIKESILKDATSHYVTASMLNDEIVAYICSVGFYKMSGYRYIVYVPETPGYLLSLPLYKRLYDDIVSYIRNEKINVII